MTAKKYAYVTFVMRNDSYIPGALVLAYRLLKMGTPHDLICLITPDITLSGRDALETLYTHVVIVDEIKVQHTRQHERQDRPYLFTRFNVLRLGLDGDLGFDYDKIVMMDADIMPLTGYDALFNINTPAGIINEKKEHWYVHDDKVMDDGRTIWHSVYEEICAHGLPIPSFITDRVWHDSSNMGVNACLWVLEPNMMDYNNILNIVGCHKVLDKISTFNWPEMQFATAYYSGRWHSIDIRYCAYNAYPSVEMVKGTHFAGLKPWNDKNHKALSHYFGHDDYRMWYKELYEMCMWVFPKLKNMPKIRRLLRFYNKASK